MPLYVSLMLEIIADTDGDDSKIEEQLEKLPGDVEPIYEKNSFRFKVHPTESLQKRCFNG